MAHTLQWISRNPARGIRLCLGLGILVTGLASLGQEFWSTASTTVAWVLSSPESANTLRISALAGAATGAGALALLMVKRVDEQGLGLFMTIAGGMMGGAALFSLFWPAVSTEGMSWIAVGATLAGFVLMGLLDATLPHEHPMERASQNPVRTAALLTVAIALHNVPEGFAVGASPASTASATGISIGLQNIPEGLIVATALWFAGVSKLTAASLALLTGLIEPLGAVIGLATAQSWDSGSVVAMGLAAGAMAFVVVHEIWPETRKRIASGPALKTLLFSGGLTSLFLNLMT